MKTAAVYIRVSTDDQLEYSPATQLKELKNYAKNHDMIIENDFVFVDEGISGRNVKKREAFNKMIVTAKKKPRPFEVILVWKFSRFARNQEESIVYKSLLRKQLGIDVVSISEPLVEGPFGSLIERIIEWMDEYYSIRLSGEVTRGMTGKAESGGFQTAPAFGYKKESGLPLSVVEEEAKYVRYVFERYLAGDTFFSIAGKLNAMGITTKRGNPFEGRQIEYMLNNPVYKGYMRWTPGGNSVSNRDFNNPSTIIVRAEDSSYLPIIDAGIFDAVAAKLKESKQRRKRGERPSETKKHYLSGLLRCSSCGSVLVYQSANNGFQCYKYAHGACKPSHYIGALKIERFILDYLGNACLPSTYIYGVRKLDHITDEITIVNKEITELKKMFTRAKQAFITGIDTLADYGENKKAIQFKIDEKEKVLDSLTSKPQAINYNSLKHQIYSIGEILLSPSFTVADKNRALSSIVEKVEFSRPLETIKIFFYQ